MPDDPAPPALLDEIVELVRHNVGPMPGAKLKASLLNRYPRGTPLGDYLLARKFIAIVQQASDRIDIHLKAGTDMRLVPKGEAQPLDLFLGRPRIRIRDDFYRAFAYVAQEGPYPYVFYDRVERKVVFHSTDEQQPELISIPGRTRQQEIDLRLEFVNHLRRPEIVEACQPLTTSTDPFTWFSAKMVELNLSRQWLMFRNYDIKQRIEQWCAESSVDIDPSWFPLVESAATQEDRQQKLRAVLGKLSDSDLQRVMVPLDLLLKLL